jgi:hypothetical protein
VAAPVGPSGPDVVGVRLGMSFEDAERLIREHMAVGRSLVADRAWQVKAATGEIEPFTSGRLFESEDGSEIIVLYDEPPAAPGIVLGIVRQIALPKGQASPAQVVAQLEQKYGQAAQSTEQQLVWVEGESPGQRPDRHCVPAPNAAADLRIWRDSEGADPSWQPTTLRYPQSTPGLGASAPGSPAAAASCRPVLAATFDTRQNREWDRLVLRVVDQRAYAEQHLESRRLIERGEGAIGAAGPAAAKVDLKL